MKNIIKNTNLSGYIVQALEEKIIKGELKPGERIIDKELCEMYGVSITPVREALYMSCRQTPDRSLSWPGSSLQVSLHSPLPSAPCMPGYRNSQIHRPGLL